MTKAEEYAESVRYFIELGDRYKGVGVLLTKTSEGAAEELAEEYELDREEIRRHQRKLEEASNSILDGELSMEDILEEV